MKKYLPFILLALGIIIAVVTVVLIVRKNKKEPAVEKETLVELPLIERPVASLTPSADGHWLTLRVEKLKSSLTSMDYELLYELPDGRTQGVPGSVKLNGLTYIERKLLLGSESSGKFRYDEGVKEGTLTLRFRNEAGKLVNKYSTKFALLSKTKELVSVDEKFGYTTNTLNSKDFFVVMETFGVPSEVTGTLASGPFGVFSSAAAGVSGTVKLEGTTIYKGTTSTWQKIEAGKSADIGIFVGTE